jgi:cholest-4-en-3-one 26-monooxygenase
VNSGGDRRDESVPLVTGFNFLDVNAFAQGAPFAALARLRREQPLYWHPMPTPRQPADGFWLATKHEDIVYIEKHPDIFSSHAGLTIVDPPPRTLGPATAMMVDGLAHLDPPEHAAHRQVVAQLFTPRAVTALEPTIKAIAAAVIDRAVARLTVDFATDVALRVPVTVVIGHLMGLPESDFARVIDWNDFIFSPDDPKYPPWTGAQVVQDLYEYGVRVIAARRREPQGDALSTLLGTRSATGQPMSDEMFLRYFWSLLTGAFDTTASAIAGGMHALLSRPTEYEKLRANPALIRGAVEEMLRWVSPTIYFRRTATRDTILRGQTIRRGQRVVMCYASANRDEDVFDDPDVFDVTRARNDHLAFGYGEHFCLGASLARAEIRIVFEHLVARGVRVELRGPLEYAKSNFLNGIRHMPVILSASV